MLLALGILLLVSSCNKEYVDICFDDLNDKDIISGEVIIACFKYEGNKVNKVLINNIEQSLSDPLHCSDPGYYRLELFFKNNLPCLIDLKKLIQE